MSKSSYHNEEALIIALKNQDVEAMSVLYDRYSPILFGIILRIVKSKPIAEDVLQESLMNIWKNIQTYNSKKGRFVSWMMQIARNKAIDKVRSAGYKHTQRNMEVTELTKNAPQTSLNIDVIGVRTLVGKLPKKYSEVIELAYFDGLTHAEMAETLNLPLGTVKSRVRIALRELRKMTKN